MSLPNSVAARDQRYVVHPYTDLRRQEAKGPIVIESGDGIYVEDDNGNRYIEAMSGLWSVAVGFGEQRLIDAATRQLSRLPFYHTFSGKANQPAADLAERLVALSPKGLERVFFTNSGSEANDTVVKLVWYYNSARGLPQKRKFLARHRAYHGVTVASASLTGLPVNHAGFELPAIPVRHLTCPHHYRNALPGETEEVFALRLVAELEEVILEEGPETIAAFIGEPLMGAGGVIPPPRSYWAKVQAVCRRHDILVVADEVITGFGRLGRWFGSEVYDIQPDILVVSKQLTSSYQPLAALLMSNPIYQQVADASAALGTFGHGFTTSGNPVSCAVALANLDVIEERGLVANAEALGQAMHAGLADMSDLPLVGEVRGSGLIAGIELVADKATRRAFDPSKRVGLRFFEAAHRHGLIVRAIGDTIALCPPLIITPTQMVDLLDRFRATLLEVTADVREEALL